MEYSGTFSVTKFGDPRDYAQLSDLKLFDKDGNEGGLTATYMVNGDANNVFVSRIENTIDYENLTTVKKFLLISVLQFQNCLGGRDTIR